MAHVGQKIRLCPLGPFSKLVGLAQFLPQVVDQLTPGGQLPEGGGVDLGGLLGNVLGGLMRR
jgi:hypothetical protein